MSIDLQMVDLDELIAEYNRLNDALATVQAERDAAVRALADEQARVVTLQRRLQGIETPETTVTAADPVKAAMVSFFQQHRASLMAQMSAELRDFIWMDAVVSAGVRAVLSDDAPDEDFEAQCVAIEKRLHWVAQVGVVMDGDVIFRAVSAPISFVEEA